MKEDTLAGMIVRVWFQVFWAERDPHQFSRSVVSNSLWPHGLQHARLPWITNSWSFLKLMSIELVMPSIHLILCCPFSSSLQSFPASGFFLMGQFFASGGQNIGASASTLVLLMSIRDWLPLGLTHLISLQFKGLSKVVSKTTVQKHLFLALSFLCGTALTFIHD